MEIKYIEVNQPIGVFYLCSIPASTLINVVNVKARRDSKFGYQRDQSSDRLNEIGEYCSDPDAVFPTPIVISINDDADVHINEDKHTISFKDNEIMGEVIDGQHRLLGIKRSEKISKFDLPVVLMFDLTIEEKAYIFSTINSNQKQVSSSLIYDLFDVARERSPQKTVHEIARVMNFDEASPFYNRLKMLGKKMPDQESATLSQGTFAKSILQLITKDAKEDRLNIKLSRQLMPDISLPFRQYFIEDKDEIITKILFNCFNALKQVFYEEWDDPKNNILWKSTGFRGVIYALHFLYMKGTQEHNLSQPFFEDCFIRFKDKINNEGIKLTSKDFPGGGEQGQKRIAKLIEESLNNH